MSFKTTAPLNGLAKALESDKALRSSSIKQADSVIQFVVKNKEGETKAWKLDLKEAGTLKEISEPSDADISIAVKDADLNKLINGKTSAQKLFMSGKLKVKGNVMKAAIVEKILQKAKPPKAKL
ncbi:unnamed protein product [Kuraishia capsulata CBS 1993]|uniref:SCP2 domain-containing protein n=1 Tax=Kuraishia capsulata CBS 1993 TaxID=1382522 RepID=W6MJ89_9ASCO|nr:uncharacterized protein KUCA_T00002292001 [Kuraishia capsulata CBS 1993]CDK26321.1 unnamed protein product [Kuraishia capsulata CBS 1993]